MFDSVQSTEPQEVKTVPSMAYAGGLLCFIFSSLCFLFWGNMLGFWGDGAGLAIGCIQLGVFAAYHMCSQDLFIQGNAFEGNVYMVFAALFGGVGGLVNIGSSIAHFVGVPFSDTAVGIVWLLSGLLLILILPGARKNPKVGFLFYIFGGVALTLMGLATMGLIPVSTMPVIAWLIFVVGALGFYVCIATMNGFGGVSMPLGKPFFK